MSTLPLERRGKHCKIGEILKLYWLLAEIANDKLSIYNQQMPIFKKIRANFFYPFLILCIALFAAACADSEMSNSNQANQAANSSGENRTPVSDDLTALSLIVKLPEVPKTSETIDEPETRDRDEAIWQEFETSNPKGKKLIAVLRYPQEITANIIASAEKHRAAAPTDIDAENWFPPELIAKSQETGDEFLKGLSYPANDFLQAPYTNGRLTQISDTNYFILELTTY